MTLLGIHRCHTMKLIHSLTDCCDDRAAEEEGLRVVPVVAHLLHGLFEHQLSFDTLCSKEAPQLISHA